MLHVLCVHMPMAHVHVVCSIQERMVGSNSAVRWMPLGRERTAIGDMSQLSTWCARTAFPGRSLVFNRCAWVHRRVRSPQSRAGTRSKVYQCQLMPVLAPTTTEEGSAAQQLQHTSGTPLSVCQSQQSSGTP